MAQLYVVALISGGKDSLFSLLHCIASGHKIVALANLYPPEDISLGTDDEDIDSHMYQTVGHSIVPLYAQALEIPLYRQPILGGAISKSKVYQSEPDSEGISDTDMQDETESLMPLLRACMLAHPEINAVSTGAILSSYQRTRVESVATRLGLVPLSFLWQYPFLLPYTQTSLLSDMAAVGQDARIIKVASGGLNADHLWMNVSSASAASRLGRDMSRFSGEDVGAVLGEGGEYETLAIDGPTPLWKSRITVDFNDLIPFSMGGGSAVIRIRHASLTRKKEAVGGESSACERLRIPSLWDDDFSHALQRLEKESTEPLSIFHRSSSLLQSQQKTVSKSIGLDTKQQHVFLSNLTSTNSHSVEGQMTDIGLQLIALLRIEGLTPSDVISTTLLLRSMTDFLAINRAYAVLFLRPNPPARLTVGCGDSLPVGVNVMASFVAARSPVTDGLHVQSRSYWAPANIGPYSQAISLKLNPRTEESSGVEIVYVAGQIPLVPASMEIVSQNFAEQAALALQHLWRIGQHMKVSWWSHAVVFIASTTSEEARRQAVLVGRLWKILHERPPKASTSDTEEEDIAERSLQRSWGRGKDHISRDVTPRWTLPHWEHVSGQYENQNSMQQSVLPPVVIVRVQELPRGALVEWTSTGIKSTGMITAAGDGMTGFCEAGEYSVAVEAWDRCPPRVTGDTVEIYDCTGSMGQREGYDDGKYVPCRGLYDANGVEHDLVVIRKVVP